MVWDQHNPLTVENLLDADLFKFPDGHGSRDIIGQGNIHLGIYELTGLYSLKSCVFGQNLLGDGHPHDLNS